VLGLYEAYITKMLWHHTWGGPQWPLLGISFFAFLQLVIAWHPFMSFMAPVFVMAASLPDGARILPRKAREWLASPKATRRAAVWLGVAAGLFSGDGGRPLLGLLNGMTIAALLWVLARLKGRYTLQDLLPKGREVAWLASPLALIFVVFGWGNRREALPGLGPQATIWALYAFYIWLVLRTSRISVPDAISTSPAAAVPGDQNVPTPILSPLSMAWFSVAMAATALLLCAIPHSNLIGMVLGSLFGWAGGGYLLFVTVRSALATESSAPAPTAAE
jgi:hypothetical protein